MRYLGLLTAVCLLGSPASARKHHAKPAPRHAKAQARRLPPPPPVQETKEAPTAVAKVDPPPPVVRTAQENDDEVPGSKRKK
jgi:hypothetical protein